MKLVDKVNTNKDIIYLDDFIYKDFHSIRCSTRKDVDACLNALEELGYEWNNNYKATEVMKYNAVFKNTYESLRFNGIHFFVEADKRIYWCSTSELEPDETWVDYKAGQTIIVDTRKDK